jgi:hypothetical protein
MWFVVQIPVLSVLIIFLAGCLESVPVRVTTPVPKVDVVPPAQANPSSTKATPQPNSVPSFVAPEAVEKPSPAARDDHIAAVADANPAFEARLIAGQPAIAPTLSPAVPASGMAASHTPPSSQNQSTGASSEAGNESAAGAVDNRPISKSKFDRGGAAYQIPRTMIEGRSVPVDLWIQLGTEAGELKKRLEEVLIENAKRAASASGWKLETKLRDFGETTVVAKEVLIGKNMYAQLIGQDFEIEPEGRQEQTVRDELVLKWSWQVKPKLASKDGLLLELSVWADPGDGTSPVETIRETVPVHARPWTLKEAIEQLDAVSKTALGVGLAGALGMLFRHVWKLRKRLGTGLRGLSALLIRRRLKPPIMRTRVAQ